MTSSGEIRPGFIGTGAIAEAMIIGLSECAGFREPIHVSTRSAERSTALQKRYDHVLVHADNQTIVDECNWIFLSVLPDQARELLMRLNFRKDQVLISLVAGITIDELKQLVPPLRTVHRLIPLPPIARGEGPLILFPDHAGLVSMFHNCGEILVAETEEQFLTYSAASAIMATHHQITAQVANWMTGQGIRPDNAARYASQLVRSLGSIECATSQLSDLPDEAVTVGGLNEQVLQSLRQIDWFHQIDDQLDRIAERLRS